MTRLTRKIACLAALALLSTSLALACTRALYVGDKGLVITGRTMDWSEDMRSNLWVMPAGIERDGNAGTALGQMEIEVRQRGGVGL